VSIDYSGLHFSKGPKGDSYIKARERRKAIKAAEDAAKDDVRKRDKVCRWPKCRNCAAYKPRLEVAHLDAKGMGGDHGSVSSPDQMILLDYLTHQSGPSSLEQHGRKIVPLTAKGTDGPCQFWAKDENGDWFLVAEEVSIGVYRRD
jgi:hypothetical protein